MESKDKLEYEETGKLFRLYTGFLISIMQHFIAGNVLFFIGLSYITKGSSQPSLSQILIGLMGFLGCFGCLIVQISTYDFWKSLLLRGKELDKILNTNLYETFYQTSQKRKVLTSATFATTLYSAFSIFWFIVLLKLLGVNQINIPI